MEKICLVFVNVQINSYQLYSSIQISFEVINLLKNKLFIIIQNKLT
jgi:hypothetical protein